MGVQVIWCLGRLWLDGTPEEIADLTDNIDGGPGSGGERGENGQYGGGGSTSVNLSVSKMKATPIPKDLKAKWSKAGGVDNPEYKAWIKENWAT